MTAVKDWRRKNVQLLLNAALDLVSANADKAKVLSRVFINKVSQSSVPRDGVQGSVLQVTGDG